MPRLNLFDIFGDAYIFVFMSINRIKIPNGIYHCMSRLVCWAPEFDPVSKRVFVSQMRRQEFFCGIKVVTYCVMNNHFHILLKVPAVNSDKISDDELALRYRKLYPADKKHAGHGIRMMPDVLEQILAAGGERAEAVRSELLARMHDVSVFMRELKQRFSIWYNHRTKRHGTLWSERFKSVLVEGSQSSLKIVSAYIDLNPIRAGLAGDPKDYLWSGYGAACGGSRRALFGLVWMMGGDTQSAQSVLKSLAAYRLLLYGKGSLPGPGGKSVTLDAHKAQQVRAARGQLTLSEGLLCKSRAICHGIIFGGWAFVDHVGELRRQILGHKRRVKPVSVREIEGERICTLK